MWIAAGLVALFAVTASPLIVARAASVRVLLVWTHGEPAGVLPLRAEVVRRSVDPLAMAAGPAGPFSALADAGFTGSEIEHLRDVRRVFWLALWLALGAAAGFALALAVAPPGRRCRVAASAAARGALAVSALALVAGVAGAVGFDRLFVAFHGAFFAPGTWTFPAESLLIKTFPEGFWALAGLSWAFGAVAISVLAWIAAAAVRAER